MTDKVFAVVMCVVVALATGILGFGIGQIHPVDTDAAQVFFHNLDKNGKCTTYPAKEGVADLCKTEAGVVALCTATPGLPPDCKVILDTRPRPPQTAPTPAPAPSPAPAPTPAPTPPKAGAGSGSHTK